MREMKGDKNREKSGKSYLAKTLGTKREEQKKRVEGSTDKDN